MRAVKKMLPRSASTSGCAHRLSVAPVCVFRCVCACALCMCTCVCVWFEISRQCTNVRARQCLSRSRTGNNSDSVEPPRLTFAILSPFLPPVSLRVPSEYTLSATYYLYRYLTKRKKKKRKSENTSLRASRKLIPKGDRTIRLQMRVSSG